MSRHSKYAVATSILLLFVELRAAAQPHTTQLKLKAGRPVAETYINGHGPYSFLVDTGTNRKLIISPRLAANLELKRVGAKQISDAEQNSLITGSVVGIDSIEVGGVQFAPCTALVTPLQSAGRPSVFEGILGFDLFRDWLLTLDFRRHKLLLDKGNLPPVADAKVIPFQSKNGIPVVTIIINSLSIEAAIDTGATGVMLPETVAKTLQFAEPPVLMPRAETLVDQFDVHGATLTTDIRLAAFDFEKPFVAISQAVPIVNLGADVFADFTVTFDEQSGRVILDSPQMRHRLKRKLESDFLEDPPRFRHGVSPTQ
jgi:predicted aspartyl protease